MIARTANEEVIPVVRDVKLHPIQAKPINLALFALSAALPQRRPAPAYDTLKAGPDSNP